MIFLSYLGAAWLAASLIFFLATCLAALLQPYLQARRATAVEQPPATVVMPIKLQHSGFGAAQASAFNQAYPEYEVLFSAAEPGQNHRHVDMIWPMWNLLDMTPDGRGETTHPKLRYD